MLITAPHRTSPRRYERGLTLIEIMISLAIIALLIVLVVLSFGTSDNLKCKLEAERLATYVHKAAQEAKMRSGATRVRFELKDSGSAQLLVTELRVESSGIDWTEQGSPHEVRAPVKLSEVETHASGVIKGAGESFFLFNGSYTPGGVALLTLGEAKYSVILPSNGEPAYVKEGRGELSGLLQAKRGAMPNLNPSLMDPLSSGTSKESRAGSRSSKTGSSPSMGNNPPPIPPRTPPRRPPPRSNPPAPSGDQPPLDPPPINDEPEDPEDPVCGDGQVNGDEECDDGNEDDQDACTNECVKAVCGDGIVRLDVGVEAGGEECDDGNDIDEDACTNQCREAICGDGVLREDLDPRDEGYEECDDGNQSPGDGCDALCKQECVTDQDCQGPEERGPWGVCDQSTYTCKISVPSFQLTSVTNVGLTDGGITANLSQPAIAAELQGSLQSWISAGKLTLVVTLGAFGQTYEDAHEVPSAAFFQGQQSGVGSVIARPDMPVYNYMPTYNNCSGNGVFEHCYTSSPATITLYIQLNGSGTCGYQMLTLTTTLTLSIKPGQRAQVELRGTLTPRDARQFMISQSLSLADALEGVEPTIDCNGESSKMEAWEVSITGEAIEVEVSSVPVGADPPGCNPGRGDDCDPPPTDDELQRLFDAACVRCHSDNDARGELSLSEPFREKVVDVPATTREQARLVTPRDYDSSLLYLMAMDPHGGNRSSLQTSSLDRIKDWILGL